MAQRITKLKKRMLRLIQRPGRDLVVEMTDRGLRVRQYGRHRWSRLIEFGSLESSLPASNREEAFSRPLSETWEPKPEQEVWLRRRLEGAGSRSAKGVILQLLPGMGELLVKVRIEHGGKHYDYTETVNDVRPV